MRVRWTGRIDAEALAAAWRKLFSNPEALALGRSLTDLRGAEVALSMEDLQRLVRDLSGPLLAGRPWRNAILVERPFCYGIARQFAAFAEGTAQVHVCSDQEEAERWLLGGGQ